MSNSKERSPSNKSPSESEHKIPPQWIQTTLNQVCSKITDGSHNPPKGAILGHPMLSAKNIQSGKVLFTESHRLISDADFENEDRRTQIQPGDILLTIVGTIGRTAVINSSMPKFALQRSVAVLGPQKICSKYLEHAINDGNFQQQLTQHAKGTAQKGVYLKTLRDLDVPISPLAEQKVIADKLDELLAQVDTLKARLDAIPAILKRFRQSVLAAAVSGKLTEEWRVINKLPKLKQGRMQDCVSTMTGGCSPKSSDYCNAGILTLNKGDIKPQGNLEIKNNPKRLPIEFKQKNPNKIILNGALLLTLRDLSQKADFLGLISTYKHTEEALITQGMFSLEVNTNIARPEFMVHISNSPAYRSQIKHQKIGATQVHLRNEQFLNLQISLPSIEEQSEIVRRVEQLFTYVDQVEQQVKNAQARVNQLTQSILAKAFRGELTEQWRQDNPELISGNNSAAALLERIKAERAAAKPAKKKAPARKAKA